MATAIERCRCCVFSALFSRQISSCAFLLAPRQVMIIVLVCAFLFLRARESGIVCDRECNGARFSRWRQFADGLIDCTGVLD